MTDELSTTPDPEAVLGHGLVHEAAEGYDLLDPSVVEQGVDRGDGVVGTLVPYPTIDTSLTHLNALQAVREMLIAQPQIVALCDTRVYSISLPKNFKSKLPCILLRRVGAQNDRDINAIQTPILDIRCYGATQDAADNLYAKVKALDGMVMNEKTTNYVIHSFEEISGALDMPEMTDESEQVDCVFTTYAAEITAR